MVLPVFTASTMSERARWLNFQAALKAWRLTLRVTMSVLLSLVMTAVLKRATQLSDWAKSLTYLSVRVFWAASSTRWASRLTVRARLNHLSAAALTLKRRVSCRVKGFTSLFKQVSKRLTRLSLLVVVSASLSLVTAKQVKRLLLSTLS